MTMSGWLNKESGVRKIWHPTFVTLARHSGVLSWGASDAATATHDGDGDTQHAEPPPGPAPAPAPVNTPAPAPTFF